MTSNSNLEMILRLLFTISILLTAGDVLSDRSTEYQCSNGICVDLRKFNNSVNDCGDNSDEVSNPCPYPFFSCLNNRCIGLEFVLDGTDDCNDQSDEVKRLGTNCSSVATCCRCEEFVPHSECRHQLCQCVHGYYGNDIGTTCTKRSIGDLCLWDSDCSQITNGTCLNGSCGCTPGFIRTGSNAFQCTARLLFDSCSTDVDCRFVPNSHCADDHKCACASGHVTSGGSSCELKMIGCDDCTADVDSIPSIVCAPGHVMGPDGSECVDTISMANGEGEVGGMIVAAIILVYVTAAAICFALYFFLAKKRKTDQNLQYSDFRVPVEFAAPNHGP